MKTVYTDKHKLRDAVSELCGGELVPPFECPVRAEHVLERAREAAREMLDDDPGLRRGHHVDVARYLRLRWDHMLPEPCPVKVGNAGGRRRRRRRKR